jgi:galactokinase
MTGYFDHLDLAALCDATVVREIVERNELAAKVPGIVTRITELARLVSGLNAKGISGDTRAIVAYAPGRIEVLGKHTDYAGGSSLTCAVNHSFVFVAAISDEPGVRLQDAVLSSSDFLPYEKTREGVSSSWLSYPATVIERYVLNFGRPGSGIALAFSNTIPRASGMSSSSALVVGMYLCMAALANPEETDAFEENISGGADLADYLGCVENGYSYKNLAGREGVGTRGGAQDHTAVLYSQMGHLGQFGYRPLRRLNTVALPEGAVFIIGSSGVRARKSRGALEPYNNAVALARNGLESWNQENGTAFETLGQLVSSDSFSMTRLEEAVAAMDTKTARAVVNRVQQFAEETGSILPSAIEALESGDMERFGLVVDRSQELTDRLLGNQVAETRFLASSARELGAWGASGFGAGFGGSVWAMVDQREAEGIMRQWMAEYGRSFPDRIRYARFFVDPTGPGAFVIGADAESLLLEPKF